VHLPAFMPFGQAWQGVGGFEAKFLGQSCFHAMPWRLSVIGGGLKPKA
jgi:hypothetical protein